MVICSHNIFFTFIKYFVLTLSGLLCSRLVFVFTPSIQDTIEVNNLRHKPFVYNVDTLPLRQIYNIKYYSKLMLTVFIIILSSVVT